MKGAILSFIFLLNILNFCFSQEYKPGEIIKNKDLDNFAGDWVYKSCDTVFRISMHKVVLSANKFAPERVINPNTDVLYESILGCYEFIVNNKLQENTMKYKNVDFDYSNHLNPIQLRTLDSKNSTIIIILNNEAKQYSIIVELYKLTNNTISWKIIGKPKEYKKVYSDPFMVNVITGKKPEAKSVIKLTLPDNIILTREN